VIYVMRYLLIVLYTVIWGTLGILLAVADRSGRAILWVGRCWVSWCLDTCGVRVEVDGVENVTANQPCIVMSNHQSVFDIPALVRALPVDWKFVAKRELLRVPFFGWALALADQIIVDRFDRESAVRSLSSGAERIRAGANVIVFPEGTRSPDAVLRNFKSGGFYLALEAGVPIVPATVSGSQHITPKGSLRIESGRIRVRFGRPIPIGHLGLDDRNELKRQVRDAILAGYDPDLQENLGLPTAPGPT
jgi:1-acyl-sn-glycerol-3-phosphate acyltransferase